MPTPEHSKQDAIAAVEALVEATNRRATVTPTAPGIATVEVAAKHTTNDAPTELERVLGDNYEIETEATRGGLLIRVQSVRGEYQGPAQDVLLSTRRQTDGRDDDPDPAGRGDDQAGLGDF